MGCRLQLDAFLTLELKGGELSGTFPGGFTHGVTNEKEARKGLRDLV
jgi:hypothetical protein